MPAKVCGECGQWFESHVKTEKVCAPCNDAAPRQSLTVLPEGDVAVPSVPATPTVRTTAGRRHFNPARYGQLFKQQGGKCACCKQKETLLDEDGKPKRLELYVHRASLVVIGLVCTLCNIMLHAGRDSVLILAQAIAFLNQPTGPLDTGREVKR